MSWNCEFILFNYFLILCASVDYQVQPVVSLTLTIPFKHSSVPCLYARYKELQLLWSLIKALWNLQIYGYNMHFAEDDELKNCLLSHVLWIISYYLKILFLVFYWPNGSTLNFIFVVLCCNHLIIYLLVKNFLPDFCLEDFLLTNFMSFRD